MMLSRAHYSYKPRVAHPVSRGTSLLMAVTENSILLTLLTNC